MGLEVFLTFECIRLDQTGFIVYQFKGALVLSRFYIAF